MIIVTPHIEPGPFTLLQCLGHPQRFCRRSNTTTGAHDSRKPIIDIKLNLPLSVGLFVGQPFLLRFRMKYLATSLPLKQWHIEQHCHPIPDASKPKDRTVIRPSFET